MKSSKSGWFCADKDATVKLAKEKPQTSAHLFARPEHHGAFVVFQLARRSRTFPRRTLPYVNTCRYTWRLNCDVSPNDSRIGDLSGCSETCRSPGASLSEQDGQWLAAGPLSRAELQASSQNKRKRRNPGRAFKIHPILSDQILNTN